MNLHLCFRRYLALSLCCLALNACAASGDDTATQARLGDQLLVLEERSGQCLLRSADQQLPLKLNWPCRFNLRADGSLRTEMLAETPVLLVENSQPPTAPSRDCRTEVQAVRQLPGGLLEASPATNLAAACPPFDWDQKLFFGLF